MNDELKSKITEAISSDIIGLVEFDADEMDEMIADCRKNYKSAQAKYIKGFTVEETAELIVLIVNVSKSWNTESDSRYWTKLFGEIFDDGSISPIKFYNDFENCLKKYHHTLFRSKENKRMFKEVFLFHALSPEASSEAFIRLLWSWYSDIEVMNFNYQADDDLYYKMGFYLKNQFAGESNYDDDVSLEGKTYTIKASLKYIFMQDTEKGIKLLDRILYNIDKIYYNERITDQDLIYQKCNNVISKIFSENRTVKTRKHRQQTNTITDYNSIKAEYEIAGDLNTFVSIPEIRAIDEVAERYEVNICNGQKVIETISGEIYGKDLKRRIKKIQIPLDQIMKYFKRRITLRITLSVLRNGERVELYDSKETLYRSFIFFGNTREIRTDVCKPGAYYIVKPEFLNLEEASHCSFSATGKYSYSINAINDDFILTDDKQIYFSEELKKSYCMVDGDEIENLYYEKAGEEIQVYKNVYGLSLLLDSRINTNGINVMFSNGNRYVLSTISTIRDNRYYIALDIGYNIDKGDNQIIIQDTVKNKVLHSIEFYVDENIDVDGAEYVFGSRNPLLTVYYEDEEKVSFGMMASDENKEFQLNDNNFIYYYPYIKWTIDDNYWQYEAPDAEYWCNDSQFHNNCIIQADNHSKQNVSILINGTEMNKGRNGNYLLGDSLIENSHVEKNEITIRIGNSEETLFTVYNQPQLTDFDISLEQKYIDFSEYFIGDEEQKFRVVMENEDDDSYTYDFECRLVDTFEPDIEDGIYTVTIYTVDMWGNEREVYNEEGISIGNPNKYWFKDCQIILTKFKNPDGRNVKLNNITIDAINYLRDEGDTGVYSAVLHDKRLKFDVELYVKDDRALKIYMISNDDIRTLGYDQNRNNFVSKEVNGQDIIPCVSCYYEMEEV